MKPHEMLKTFAGSFGAAFAVASMVFIGGMMIASPAFAQGVVSAGVDFAPTLNSVIGTLAVIATAGGGVVIKFLVAYLAGKANLQNTELSALAEEKLNRALNLAIEYAELWMKSQIADPKSQIRNVQFDNFFLEQAVKYAISSIPGWILDHFKLRVNGVIDTARIADMIRARLNKFIPVPVLNSDVIGTASMPIAPMPSAPTSAAAFNAAHETSS